MSIQKILRSATQTALQQLYQVGVENVEFQATRKEFEGDITIVVFSFLRQIKGNPVEIGTQLGNYLKDNVVEVVDFNVVKGFLNLVFSDAYLHTVFSQVFNAEQYGISKQGGIYEIIYWGILLQKFSKQLVIKYIKLKLSMTVEYIFVSLCWHIINMEMMNHPNLRV